jgi:ATP-dependent exoDNAse (exonuclease V) beta subunit
MGMTEEEVIAMWEQKGKESRELGTAMHQKIESYYQGKQPYEDDAFRLFKVFADKVKLEPYRTEWAVYDTDYNIAGTIDFVDYQDGKYTIYDWKRSDKIIANGMPVKVSKYQEKGLYPLEHLENCAYYHYALQLSLYKFILEKNYDIKVSDLRLGIFHPSYDKPYVLKMPYLENEVKTLMELRSEVIL